MYNKIIEKAKMEALEIENSTKQKIEDTTLSLMAKTKETIDKVLCDAHEKNLDLLKTKKAELEQTFKQSILANKKRLISEIFSKACEKMLNSTDSEFKNFVYTYFKRIEFVGGEIIKVSKNEYSRYQNLFSSNKNENLDLLVKELNLNGINITLSATYANISGGFIVEGKYYDVDYSYEEILKTKEESLITEVAKILF